MEALSTSVQRVTKLVKTVTLGEQVHHLSAQIVDVKIELLDKMEEMVEIIKDANQAKRMLQLAERKVEVRGTLSDPATVTHARHVFKVEEGDSVVKRVLTKGAAVVMLGMEVGIADANGVHTLIESSVVSVYNQLNRFFYFALLLPTVL